mmetsp:Transcript_101661/g.180550  ORF Transcript_101661/g.180550 Transcript_101661/m.180550 type:complete len:233 (-) Transcript_101661:1713-2411(-)
MLQLPQEDASIGERYLAGLTHNLPKFACDLHSRSRALLPLAIFRGSTVLFRLRSSRSLECRSWLCHALDQVARYVTPGLYEQRFAAHGCPSQPHDHTAGSSLGKELFRGVWRLAHQLPQILDSDSKSFPLVFFNAHEVESNLPCNLFDQLAKLPDPSLSCVVPDKLRQRIWLQINQVLFDAVGGDRLRDEILVGNRQFLLVDIACYSDNLHSVQQRSWDGVQDVCSAYEKSL